jgi:hypothetical protein
MSQEAGTSGTPKFFSFFWDIIFTSLSDWLCLKIQSSTQGSMVSYATVLGIPTSYSPARGDQVLAFCTPNDWTGNLTMNSPTLQPLNQVADGISCQNVSIYCPGCPMTSREFKNSKFKFCKDQESKSVPRGCQCHRTPYTTRPKVLIQEQQIWKCNLDQTSSCQSYIKIYFFRFRRGFRP